MELDRKSKAILKELCSNSRVKMRLLSEKFGVSRYLITKEVEELENELGLRYTLELNYSRLGFGTIHVAYLNFAKKPREKVLEEVVNKITAIQLALLMKGDFELLCFVVTKTPIEYSQVEIALQLQLQEFGARVKSSEVTLPRLGFIALNNALISKAEVGDVYKKILVSLNTNSRARLSEVSKETGTSEDLVRYYMTKMEKEGIIRRYTALVTKPNTKFTIAFLVNYSVRENLQARIDKERRNIIFSDDDRSNVNSFQMMFSTTGAEQTFDLATYLNKKYGIEHSIEAHNKIYAVDKPEVRSAQVIKPLKGMLPFRYIDVASSYDLTNWPLEFS